jgi:hypothetical protein
VRADDRARPSGRETSARSKARGGGATRKSSGKRDADKRPGAQLVAIARGMEARMSKLRKGENLCVEDSRPRCGESDSPSPAEKAAYSHNIESCSSTPLSSDDSTPINSSTHIECATLDLAGRPCEGPSPRLRFH